MRTSHSTVGMVQPSMLLYHLQSILRSSVHAQHPADTEVLCISAEHPSLLSASLLSLTKRALTNKEKGMSSSSPEPLFKRSSIMQSGRISSLGRPMTPRRTSSSAPIHPARSSSRYKSLSSLQLLTTSLCPHLGQTSPIAGGVTFRAKPSRKHMRSKVPTRRSS